MTIDGQLYPLISDAVIVQRRAWMFSTKDPIDRTNVSNTYTESCHGGSYPEPVGDPAYEGVVQNNPPTAWYFPCVEFDLGIDDIGEVDAGGPNAKLKWVKDVRDTSHFGWMMHSNYLPSHTFYDMQCGNWVPDGANACPAIGSQFSPAGTGFINRDALKDGVRRHEVGAINSHHAETIAYANVPEHNLKYVAENQLGTTTSEKIDLLFSVQNLLIDKIKPIEDASIQEPCFAECDETCTVWNGGENVLNPNYAVCTEPDFGGRLTQSRWIWRRQ